MKKILKKYCLVIMLILSLIMESSYVFAADEDMQNDSISENVQPVEELSIDLDSSIAEYFNSYRDYDSIINIKELKISAKNGYMLTKEDLDFLKSNLVSLTKLDVTNCKFDSKQTFEDFKNQFIGEIEFLYDENSTYLYSDENNEENQDQIFAFSSYLNDNVAKSLEVKLNGICINERGNQIDVGVAYESNDPNIQFRWLQYDLSSNLWSELSDWNNGNWITWMPKKVGDYWLYVEAKTDDGNVVSTVCGYHYEGLKVELSGICVLDKGTRYDMGVAYKSNDPGLTFQWKIYNLAEKKWTLLQDRTAGNWTSWSPEKEGDYWIYVEAENSEGNIYTYTMGFHFEGLKISLSGICVIENGKQVDMGVAYDTNDAEVEFQWKLYDLTERKWSQISDWNKGNWTSWHPSKAGDYWLYVEAKTRDGQTKSQVFGYRVNGAEIISFTTSPESPYWKNCKIQLIGKTKDPIGEIAYSRNLVYDGKSWEELPQNDDGIAEWCPDELGNYLLCFEIYNHEGKLIEQSFKGYSIEEPFAELSGIYIRQDGAMKYAMAASCKTNDRTIQYRWLYYDVAMGQWHEISGWSNSNAVSWSAPKEGDFWIHVEAKLYDGTVNSYTMGYTVQQYPIEIRTMMLLANNYSSSTPYIIMVNRNTHKVGIFQGWQGNWRSVYYWDCANGAANTPTVSGVFTIGSRGYYFDSGNSRCYWWTQFYGNYLFHSVLYNKNGTLQDGRVGMALSHGCVRLQINNAKWIYDNIPSGTKVVVY